MSGFFGNSKKSSFRKLTGYILTEYFQAFLVAFLFFLVIFIINQFLLILQNILSKQDVPMRVVFKLLVYTLPTVISIAFPFATLVATLMSYSRMSGDNEILAMRCSGVKNGRIFIPVLFVGFIFSVFATYVNDYLIPLGNKNFVELLVSQTLQSPELELTPYSVKAVENSYIVMGNVQGQKIDQLTIIEKDEEGGTKVIIAEEGQVSGSVSGGRPLFIFNLDKVLQIKGQRYKRGSYSYIEAERMTYNLPLELGVDITVLQPRNMRLSDVLAVIKEKEAAFKQRVLKQETNNFFVFSDLYARWVEMNRETYQRSIPSYVQELQQNYQYYLSLVENPLQDRSLQNWKMEFHHKLVFPMSCISFVMVGFPLGLYSKRSGRFVGFVIGLLLTIVYWVLSVVVRWIILQYNADVVTLMWFPNVLLLFLGIYLYVMRLRA